MSYSKGAYRYLDVGGTFIKCPGVRPVPICSIGSREVIVSALKKVIGPLDGLKGIGIAIPGPFDYKEGIFLMRHKYGSVYGERFRELLDIPESIEMRFLHDVNAALLGTIGLLNGKDKNTALVTLGTGLGFSYAIRGEVKCNDNGSPERILWNQPCDGGILEDRISGRGISIAYARATGDGTQSAYSIAIKAYQGDGAAQKVYADCGALLGEELQKILPPLEIDTLFIGGQIAKSLNLMLPQLEQAIPGISIGVAPEDAVFHGLKSLFEI